MATHAPFTAEASFTAETPATGLFTAEALAVWLPFTVGAPTIGLALSLLPADGVLPAAAGGAAPAVAGRVLLFAGARLTSPIDGETRSTGDETPSTRDEPASTIDEAFPTGDDTVKQDEAAGRDDTTGAEPALLRAAETAEPAEPGSDCGGLACGLQSRGASPETAAARAVAPPQPPTPRPPPAPRTEPGAAAAPAADPAAATVKKAAAGPKHVTRAAGCVSEPPAASTARPAPDSALPRPPPRSSSGLFHWRCLVSRL